MLGAQCLPQGRRENLPGLEERSRWMSALPLRSLWRLLRPLFAAALLVQGLTPAATYGEASAGTEQHYLAGAAKAEITPRVATYADTNGNGRFDMGSPREPFGFGDRVTSFVEGPIYVGNGQGPALYVYDPLYARAVVIADPLSGTKVALVAADLYLLMYSDVEAIRSMVDPSLGIGHIFIAPTHTHAGPDTLGVSGLQGVSAKDVARILWTGTAPTGINSAWFRRMRATLVSCIEEAARNIEPVRLTVADTAFGFGVRDEREPLIIDRRMVVLALDDLEGNPVATIVQWACHPESVLLLGDPRAEGRDPIVPTAQAKEAWGRTLSADFPGYLCAHLEQERGGVGLYFNGPLGGMITNLHSYVWDPEEHPAFPAAADPSLVPQDIRIPNDYRFAPLQGREAARRAMTCLSQEGREVTEVGIRVKRKEFLVPLENQFYRLMATLGIVGYEKRRLYDASGLEDRRHSWCLSGCFLPTMRFPKGKNLRTEAGLIQIGSTVEIALVPAELLPELAVGLPPDFASNPERYFPHEARYHATGKDYRLLYPPLEEQMRAPYKMILCLAGDDLGYVVPKSDFKPPHDLWVPPFTWWWYCADSETNPHYEESATASSLIEPAIMGALAELLSTEHAPR